jgi:hypothetical protein
VVALAQESGGDTFYACAIGGKWVRPFSIWVNEEPRCGSGQTVVSWNQQGPPGEPGAPGAGGAGEARISLVDPSIAFTEVGALATCSTYESFGTFCGQVADRGSFGAVIDAARYPTGATVRLEATLSILRGTGTLCARSFNVTTNAPAARSEVCITSTDPYDTGQRHSRYVGERVTSEAWPLDAGVNEYDLETMWQPTESPAGPVQVVSAQLVVTW